MPDKSDDTARVLSIAGDWLNARDPKAADRFYEAILRRTWPCPLAHEANKSGKFPHMQWNYDPWAAAGAAKPKGADEY